MSSDLPAKIKVRKMLGGNIHEAGKIIIEKRKHPVKGVGGINYSKFMLVMNSDHQKRKMCFFHERKKQVVHAQK